MIKDLVSVVLPTYNRAYCLAFTIDSVLAQTYKKFEIIIVDDGSKDDTQELVASYQVSGKIKYIRKTNGGVASARNEAIRHAQGEYLAFCDSDDIWEQWKLEVQVLCMKAFQDVGMVWTDLSAVDAAGVVLYSKYTRIGYKTWEMFTMEEIFDLRVEISEICPHFPKHTAREIYVGDIFFPMLTGNIINMPTVMIRADIVKKVGYFDESMVAGEDYDFTLRICEISRAAFVDEVFVAYRIGSPDQLTRQELIIEQAINSIRTILPIIARNKQKLNPFKKRISRILGGRYRWVGYTEFDLKQWQNARVMLLKSLFYEPFRPREWFFIFLTYMPEKFVGYLQVLYRKLKRATI